MSRVSSEAESQVVNALSLKVPSAVGYSRTRETTDVP